jgi:hypothetical protein
MMTFSRESASDGEAVPIADPTTFARSDVDGLTATERRAAEIFEQLRERNAPENCALLMQHARWAAEKEAGKDPMMFAAQNLDPLDAASVLDLDLPIAELESWTSTHRTTRPPSGWTRGR